MATIKDVAKLAGVSPSTVSRALSNKIFVEEETRQKVLQAVEALNYKPNLMAKALKDGKTQALAFFVPDINSLFYPMIMKSIEKYASEKGYALVLSNNNESIEQEKHNLNILKTRQVDGIICMSVLDEIDHLIQIQEEENLPVVLLNRYPDQDVSCVSIDNYYGGYLMTKYLLDHGHTKIVGMFGKLNRQRFRDRLEGCRQAMLERGITNYDRYFIFDVDTIDQAYQQTLNLLKNEDRPTAIFASIDIMTVGIYSAVSQSGLTIPDDLSIVGFDNIFISQYMTPPLTTYNAPIEQIAKECVDTLIALIENKNSAHEKKFFKGNLIERNSVKSI